MKSIIFGFISLIFAAGSAFAKNKKDSDDEYFSDATEIPIEVDQTITDDWADIEGPSSGSSAVFGEGTMLSDNYALWGRNDLFRQEKSISVFGGNETIASTYHFMLFPQGRFEVWKAYGHIGVPLRFPIYDNVRKGSHGHRSRGFVGAESLIMPREQDYRSLWDAQKVVRHFEMGHKDDPYLLRLSRIHTLTMGQGELLNGMSPEGFYDQDLLFMSGHAQFNNVRLGGFIGPILKAEMFGASARVLPLSGLDTAQFLRDLNFDLTYINDFMAPNTVRMEDDEYVLDSERRLVERERGSAQGVVLGAATEFVPIPWLGMKPYVSYGHLILTGIMDGGDERPVSYGSGLHFGHDAIIYFVPGTKRSVLQFKAEGRVFGNRYSPSYFGSTYWLDRSIYNERGNAVISSSPITKSEWLGYGDDAGSRFGHLFELAYGFDDFFASKVGYENARSLQNGGMIPSMRKFQFMTSLSGFDFIKLHLGYQATSIAQMDELFDFEKSRALLSLRGQLKLLPFLYFDSWAKHSFGINDMYSPANTDGGGGEPIWLASRAETRSLNFGLGLEFAMTF